MNHTDDDQFQLNGKDAHAIGVLTDHGFVVRAGAVARKDIVPSAADTVTPIRKRLLAEGVLVDDGQGLRFTQDYRFDSPSGAAAAVMGRTANGWIEWKRSDGQTLSKVKRVAPCWQVCDWQPRWPASLNCNATADDSRRSLKSKFPR